MLEDFGWTRIPTPHLQLVPKRATQIATFPGLQVFGRSSRCFLKGIFKKLDQECYQN